MHNTSSIPINDAIYNIKLCKIYINYINNKTIIINTDSALSSKIIHHPVYYNKVYPISQGKMNTNLKVFCKKMSKIIYRQCRFIEKSGDG